MSAEKKDQIDKKFFFEITNILDQMIKSTSILLKNFFLKKFSIWSLFPVLTPYLYEFAVVYIDDILIYSKTFEEYMKYLEKIFEKLRKAKLMIKLKECK